MNSSGCYQWQKEIIWSPETSCVPIPADALFTDCWLKVSQVIVKLGC